MSSNFFDQFDQPPQSGGNFFDQFDDKAPTPAKPQGGRSAGQIAKDTAFGLTGGAAGVAKPIAMALDRVRTGRWVGPATEAVDEFQESQQAGKSEELQQAAREAAERTARRGQVVTDAMGDKNLAARLLRQVAEFGSGAYEAVKNPDLLLDQAAQMGPMMKASQGVGRAAEAAGGVIAKALPARAGAVVANKAGTVGAVGAGSSIQAADVGTEAYQRLMQLPDETWQQNAEFRELAAQVGPEQAKQRIAADKAAQAAGQGGLVSLAAAALPGGAAMERALVARRLPVSAASIGRATAGEFGSEAIEEGGGRLAQNVAVAGVDPNQDVLQGVGEAAGQGGAMGGLMGGGATAVRQGLTAYADRQGKVPKAPPAEPAPAPGVPAEQAVEAPATEGRPVPQEPAGTPAAAPEPANVPAAVMADPLVDAAADLVRSSGKASLPQLQRHLRIPYKRAADLLAQLEAAGVVSAKNEEGGRTVLPGGVGFKQAFASLKGGGTTEDLYRQLYQALVDGKDVVAGVKDPVIARARPAFEAGTIQSPQDLRAFVEGGAASQQTEPQDASQIEPQAGPDAAPEAQAGQAPAPAGSDAAAGADADGLVPGAGTAPLEADGLTPAPSSNAAGQDINLQNRDRSTAASVAQMMTIAKNPDYGRLGLSRTPDAGAPMVFATGNDTMKIAPDAFGGSDVATMSDGQRVPFRYAVVSADQVEASHFADGRVNPAFSQDVLGTLKALNNGRVAGVRASYEMGAAGNYRAELERDAANLGLDPAVVARTPNPMLVRVYDEAANTAGMAAKSQAQGEALSIPEQAASDAPLIDAGLLQAYEGGGLDLAKNVGFVRGFVQRLQASGQPIGKMMQSDGRLSAEGLTRLNAALMQVAYSDTGIVEKFFASTDGDMKGIGAALKDVAADWAVMRTRALNGELPADVDVTGNLLQALRLIEQARSQGQSIYDMANQVDMETGEAPDLLTVSLLGLFFTGQHFTRPASQSTLTGRLQRYIQAASATQAGPDMFGEVVTRDDILSTIIGKESLSEPASQPDPAPAPAAQSQPEPERIGAAGDAAAAGGDRGQGRQREGAGQGAAARGAGQPGKPDGEVRARGAKSRQGTGQGARQEVAAPAADERFPRVDSITDVFAGPAGNIQPRPIAGGRPLYRETNAAGLDDLLRLDSQAQPAGFFVADSRDIAIGQGDNRGVMVSFRPDALSGSEHRKPGTGDAAGREYRTDLMAPRAVQSIEMSAADARKLRGLTKRALEDFDATPLPDGRVRFDRKGLGEADTALSQGGAERGVPLDQLQALADRVAKRLPNAPPVEVLESPRDAPMALRLHILAAQAFNDAEGAVHDGRIFMFARNLASLERAEHVLAEHEVAHAGLRAVLGSRRTRAMQMLVNLNPALRQQATQKAKTLGLSLPAAVEEVLVDMPTAELPRLKGWQRFLEMLADGLERLGLASVAATLRGGSEAQALQLAGDLIRAARDHAAGRSDATARGVRAADRLAGLQQGEQQASEVAGAAPALSSQQAGPAEPLREASTFDEARAAAKGFMGQDLVNAETGMVARVSRNSLDKMLSSKAVGKSETPAVHSLAVANADTLFRRALFGWVKPDAKGDPNITVHRFFAPLQTPGGTVIVKLTVKETRRADQPNPLYTVEAVELNEETPAAQWVDSTVRADGLDPTSIRSAGAVRSLAEWVQANNAEGEAAFSRAPATTQATNQAAGWRMAEPTRLDAFIYEAQDKLVDTKRALQAIKEQLGQLKDGFDPYLQEELFHGRAAKQTHDFLQTEVRPLLVALAQSGIPMAEFEQFLHARHAQERNEQIASINPAMPDGGSGMATADAQAYLAALPAGRRKELQALADKVDEITTGTRQYLVDTGLESQETVKAWQDAYQHYVPLQRAGLDSDGSMRGTGAGFSVRGSSTKRAMGSDRAVENILANVVMQREKAITRGEKNRVATALYGLAVKAPNKDFWAAVNPDANGRTPAELKRLEAELVGLGLSPADAAAVLIEPKQRYVDPTTGLVEERINPAARAAGNVLAVRVNGQDRFVFFNERDPRAVRMVTALKNLDAAQLGAVMSASAKVTRYFSAINTAYNPVFGLINLTRDVQAAMLNLSTTEIAGHELEVAKQLPAALKGIMQSLRARRDSRTASGQWAKLFDEFEEAGGRTGYRDMYATALDRTAELESELKRASNAEGVAKRTWRATMDLLNDYNDTMENSVRLAAFKVAREQGLTDDQAASLAKNLTVNFNRKGNVTTQVGALYAFFNASVQGTTRLAQTMRGPLGKKILMGGMLLGSLQVLLLAAAGFDDDQPPEFIRERNFIIPIGDGKYIAIPMPLGFHVIPNLTRIPTEWAMSGFKDTGKRIVDLLGIFAGAFNPIGNAGLSIQTVAPTILDPFVALSENKDFAGRPIAKEDFGNRETPGFTRKRDTSSWISTKITEAINWLSGGTDFKPGAFSPTPDQLDYLFGQVTGGVGRELNKAYTTADSFRTGDELPAYKIPLFGRLYGDTKEGASVRSTYFDNLRELRLHGQEIKGRKETRQDVKGYVAENPEAKLVAEAKRTEKVVGNLRKLRRELVEKDAPAARIKALDQRMQREMEKLNEAVRAAKKATSAPAR